MNGDYKIISEKVISSPDNKTSVLVDTTLQTPDNKVVVWQYIKSRDAVTIAALNDKQQIYCVRQWRPARKDYAWELPAGKVEDDNPSIAQILLNANRELQEEVGMKANKLEAISSFSPAINMTTRHHVVMATNLESSTMPKDAGEILEVKLLPFNEAFDLLAKNNLPTALTLVAMLLVKSRLNLN